MKSVAFLVYFVVKSRRLFDEVDELLVHVYGAFRALQQHVVLALRVVDLEEKLGLPLVLAGYLAEFECCLVVQLIGIDGYGNSLYGFFLERLQVFDVLYLQFVYVGVGEPLLPLGYYVYGAALCKVAKVVCPVVSEEH